MQTVIPAEHTPLPWHVEGPDMFGDFNICHQADSLAVGAVVANLRPPEEVQANAALIVRAVNSHEALVEALRGVEEFVAGLAEDDLDEIVADNGVTAGMFYQQQARTVVAPRIRAALALAEQQP